MPALLQHVRAEVAEVVMLRTLAEQRARSVDVLAVEGTASAADVRLALRRTAHGDILHTVDDDIFR